MLTFFAFLQDEDSGSLLAPVLDFLTQEGMRGVPGARATALNWLIMGFVSAVLVACLMVASKWFRKENAVGKQKHWPLSKVFGFLLIGLPVVFLVLLAIYYFNLNFTMIVGVVGLFKGALLSWFFYCACMVGCDLIFPWSRTDYGLR